MFCEKQAKQVVRHGNVRSTYSSDEEREQWNSDDSVDEAGKSFGVHLKSHDRYTYVDAMTNRLNETDARLLRASINNKEKKKPLGHLNGVDPENGILNEDYTNEQNMTNQGFTKKVSFGPNDGQPQGPPPRKPKINVTKNTTVITSGANNGATDTSRNMSYRGAKEQDKLTGEIDDVAKRDH